MYLAVTGWTLEVVRR